MFTVCCQWRGQAHTPSFVNSLKTRRTQSRSVHSLGPYGEHVPPKLPCTKVAVLWWHGSTTHHTFHSEPRHHTFHSEPRHSTGVSCVFVPQAVHATYDVRQTTKCTLYTLPNARDLARDRRITPLDSPQTASCAPIYTSHRSCDVDAQQSKHNSRP